MFRSRAPLTAPLHSGALLSPRRLAAVWSVMALIALLAWFLVIRQASGTGAGMGKMGKVGMSMPVFLLLWVVMMIAMMFPSVAPVAVTWARSIGRQTSGVARAARVTQFTAGYLASWTAFGLLVYGILVLTGELVADRPQAGRWIGAGAFLAAALAQFTGLKDVCLRHCRSPMGQLMRYAGFRPRARDLRVGMHHGLYCLGCCWGLMIVLIPLGSMNIAAMAAVAVIIFMEKLWRLGPVLSMAVGGLFLVLALVTALGLFHGVLLPGLPEARPPKAALD